MCAPFTYISLYYLNARSLAHLHCNSLACKRVTSTHSAQALEVNIFATRNSRTRRRVRCCNISCVSAATPKKSNVVLHSIDRWIG